MYLKNGIGGEMLKNGGQVSYLHQLTMLGDINADSHEISVNKIYTNDVEDLVGSNINMRSSLNIRNYALNHILTPVTLGVGVTTFVLLGNAMIVTGDGGGNVIATITGALTGQILRLLFVDANVTISNDDGHGANTIDLEGAGDFVSADDSILILMFDGTSWYQIGEVVN